MLSANDWYLERPPIDHGTAGEKKCDLTVLFSRTTRLRVPLGCGWMTSAALLSRYLCPTASQRKRRFDSSTLRASFPVRRGPTRTFRRGHLGGWDEQHPPPSGESECYHVDHHHRTTNRHLKASLNDGTLLRAYRQSRLVALFVYLYRHERRQRYSPFLRRASRSGQRRAMPSPCATSLVNPPDGLPRIPPYNPKTSILPISVPV